jgi:hypothetical protein
LRTDGGYRQRRQQTALLVRNVSIMVEILRLFIVPQLAPPDHGATSGIRFSLSEFPMRAIVSLPPDFTVPLSPAHSFFIACLLASGCRA